MMVPAPPLLSNAHLQTLLGVMDPFARFPSGEPVRVHVAGGGSLDGRYFQANIDANGPAALVLHGITGAATDSTILRIAAKLVARGVSALSITMRGGPGSRGGSPPLFHAGSTDDVRAALSFLSQKHSQVAGVGISLGGHLLLLTLAEWGREAPHEVKAIAAISPPMDIEATAQFLDAGISRVYQEYMVRRLLERAAHARDHLPEEVRPHLIGKKKTVRSVHGYNERMSASVWGFGDLRAYHEGTHVGCKMQSIVRPVLVLAAEDDPVVPIAAVRDALGGAPPWVSSIVLPHGGHVGFIATERVLGDPDRRWGENRAVDFLCAQLHSG
jgi:predicted alpha/beta-fold hydrolase